MQNGTLAGIRVAVVVSSLEPGGAESIALRLALDWQGAGAKVHAFTLIGATAPGGGQVPATRLGAYNAPRAAGLAGSGIALVAAVRELAGAIKSFAPDVIVAHTDRTNVLALIAAANLAPVAIVEHNHYRLHPIGRLWSGLRAATYGRAAAVVTVSEGLLEPLPRRLRARARAIPNPVLPPERQVARGDLRRLVAMGRLTPQKGFDILLEAFARLSGEIPGLSLTLFGEGESRPALEAQIKRLGLGGKVGLPGRAADAAAALQDQGLFVFPSRYEGFGLALAEAMAAGLPVVAAACEHGPGEIVRHGIDGLLVPAGDPQALAGAIAELIADPPLADRLAGRAPEVVERFSLEGHLERWRRLVTELARPEGSGTAAP